MGAAGPHAVTATTAVDNRRHRNQRIRRTRGPTSDTPAPGVSMFEMLVRPTCLPAAHGVQGSAVRLLVATDDEVHTHQKLPALASGLRPRLTPRHVLPVWV